MVGRRWGGGKKRRGQRVAERQRERKGFTVRETNVRGKGRWRDGHVGGKRSEMERKRETVSAGAEQKEPDRDDLLMPSLTQIASHFVTTIQGDSEMR